MDEDRIWNPSSIQESVFGKMTREFASLDPKMGGLVKLFCLANAKRWNLIPGTLERKIDVEGKEGEREEYELILDGRFRRRMCPGSTGGRSQSR